MTIKPSAATIDTHTPGPWHITANNGEYTIADEEGSIIVDYMPGVYEEQLANARLITAAPDLLATLEMCAGFDDHDWTDEQAAMVNSAIAKARGQL